MAASAEIWLEASIATLSDCASMFEADNLEVLGISLQLPSYTGGAYISVVGTEQSVELGVVCTPESQQALAQRFLGAEAALEPDEVADAMREIANIVAGGLKTVMIQHDPSLLLGLPLFIDGVHLGANTRTHVAKVNLIGQELCLVVIVRG